MIPKEIQKFSQKKFKKNDTNWKKNIKMISIKKYENDTNYKYIYKWYQLKKM